MPYDLTIQGYADFTRQTSIFSQRKISRDPLSGVVDGSNTIFGANYYPILTSGSFLVYSSGSLVSGVADYDTGEITLDAAPLDQPRATYQFTPYTSQQTTRILMEGFYEMEARWSRGYTLIDSSGSPATETSPSILIVDRTTGSDPQCGPTLFSVSAAQVGFFQACVRYQFLALQLVDSAIGDYMYRDSRLLTIDKSKRPENIERALNAAEERIRNAMEQAQIEQITDGSNFGGAGGVQPSIDYQINFEWQTDGVVPPTGYNVSTRRF